MNNVRFKIGDFVKIINDRYYAYYGLSNCILKVIDIKVINSDNIKMDGCVCVKLETLNGKSIEGGNTNSIFINQIDIDFYRLTD